MHLISAIEFKDRHMTAKQDRVCLHDLFHRQSTEYLAPEKSLFLEGDVSSHVFEIIDGALRLFKIVSDGRRVITGFVYAGDFVGLSLARRYLYSAEAICGTTVRRLSRNQLEDAVNECRYLRPIFFSVVSDEMAAAQDQMVLLACKKAEERLCSFLLNFLKRNTMRGARHTCMDLPMCRQDIADYLGMTIETVSRMFTKLIGRGILKIEDATTRHTITVLKPGALVQLAGEEDAYDDDRRVPQLKAGTRH